MFSKAQQPQQTPSAKATTPFFKPEPTFKSLATEQQVQRNVIPLSPVASNPRLPIQAKLTVGQPNDKYEQEADAMADKVVQRWAMPHAVAAIPTISPFNINAAQRACAACEKEDHDHIQRKESGEMTASPSVESRLSATKGGGNPLPESTRTHMESSIGADFSNVRVHTGGEAVQLSQDLSAHAFTHGSDVYFNSGKFAPDTDSGRHLLAHELVHTVQQGGSGTNLQRMLACPPQLTVTDPPPSGWKDYYGPASVFHCGFRGILENRIPTLEDPQNECFYDTDGVIVNDRHEFSGCQGTPNQYDSNNDKIRHFFVDSGGIVARGADAYSESRRYDRYRHLPNMATRVCEARFDRCLEHSRMGGMDCMPARQACYARIPSPTSGGETVAPVIQRTVSEVIQRYDTPEHVQFGLTNGVDEVIIIDGEQVTYGEIIAMAGDLFENPSDIYNAKKSDLMPVVKLVRDSKTRTIGEKEWETATKGQYVKLASKNSPHFAPSNSSLLPSSGKSTSENHKDYWIKHHQEAIKESKNGDINKARIINAFADHFLTDAFAAGHLFNKFDAIEKFNKILPLKKDYLLGEVASRSWLNVKDTMKHFEYQIGNLWLTFTYEAEFKGLLEKIQKIKPDAIENAMAKGLHDSLNTWGNKSGIEVENKKGDKWMLSGDTTLNTKTLEIVRKAVAASKLDLLRNSLNPLEAWDYTPSFTASSLNTAKTEIDIKTDAGNISTAIAMADLVTKQINFILEEALKAAPNDIRKKQRSVIDCGITCSTQTAAAKQWCLHSCLNN
jgi:Domain of unknown function (DUF4157)